VHQKEKKGGKKAKEEISENYQQDNGGKKITETLGATPDRQKD